MSNGGKKIVDARADAKGNIEAVRFEGNVNFTSQKRAIEMAKAGKVDNAHAVQPKGREPYLRSNPDDKKGNNLDDMAGDT